MSLDRKAYTQPGDSPNALRVYDWIRAYCLAKGQFPTMEVMRIGLGYASNQSISDYLNALEKAGKVGRLRQTNGRPGRRYLVGMTTLAEGWKLVTTADELAAWERTYKRRQA